MEQRNIVLMKCGHTANAICNGKPSCVVCGCIEIDTQKLNLKNRKAQCSYCGKIVESDMSLPFFEYKPDKEFDEYYCGCGGWD